MDPRAEYESRQRARQAEVDRLGRRDGALSHVRLGLFVLALVVGYLAWGARRVPGWVELFPVVAFLIVVVLHDRALRVRRRMERAVAFYRRGLDRLDDRWRGHGVDGARFDDEHHPYARDLDLFGRGSLFERLCTSRTQAGEDTLARWLRGPAPLDEVQARQAAVRELRDRLDLREELWLFGADVRAEVDPSALSRWATAPAPAPIARTRAWLPIVLVALAAAAVTTLVGWLGFEWGWSPLVAVVFVEYLVTRQLGDSVDEVARGVDRPGEQMQVLALVLARLEREPMTSPKLRALVESLRVDGVPASEEIARLARLAHLIQARQNQFFAPFAYLLMWGPLLAFRIESWRARAGAAVLRWMEALGEIEALLSVAGYAWENPADVLPEVIDGAPQVEGHGLGHPLLPTAVCVRNDVQLGGALHLLLVSGSNMSGKSTLLRTLGINVVLALAGAPVRATAMRLTPLQVGATLRVQDSLEQGASRFYAEIKRLRQLVDLAGKQPPLLFLLDEILAGTNSHDRRLGAEAVVRGLLAQGAIGLVTTHDLALADMAEALGTSATNVHFEDTLVDGELRFDYRMRPGVVRKSNALELMRAVGLQV